MSQIPNNIIVVPENIEFGAAGETMQLKVVVEDQYGLVIEEPSLSFDSSNKKAAEQLLEIASPVVAGEKVIAEIQISNAYLYIPDRPGYRDIVESAKAAL